MRFSHKKLRMKKLPLTVLLKRIFDKTVKAKISLKKNVETLIIY